MELDAKLGSVRHSLVADSSLTLQDTCRLLRMRKWLFEKIEEPNAGFVECTDKRAFQQLGDVPVPFIVRYVVVEAVVVGMTVRITKKICDGVTVRGSAFPSAQGQRLDAEPLHRTVEQVFRSPFLKGFPRDRKFEQTVEQSVESHLLPLLR